MVRQTLARILTGAVLSGTLTLNPVRSAGPLPTTIVTPVPANDDEPLTLGAGVKPPELIERVDPVYPAEERHAGIRGKVVLEAVIDDRGKVDRVVVLRGIKGHPSFSGEAVKAVRRWTYRPATRDGVPVKVRFTVTVGFVPGLRDFRGI